MSFSKPYANSSDHYILMPWCFFNLHRSFSQIYWLLCFYWFFLSLTDHLLSMESERPASVLQLAGEKLVRIPRLESTGVTTLILDDNCVSRIENLDSLDQLRQVQWYSSLRVYYFRISTMEVLLFSLAAVSRK